MQEIKFRAWDIERREMHYVVGIDSNDTEPRCVTGSTIDSLQQLPLNKAVLMQFIGLLDQNGKEIYEGDIIRWLDPIVSNEMIAEVFWLQGGVRFDAVCYPKIGFTTSIQLWHKSEVIGNIYENPELMEENNS